MEPLNKLILNNKIVDMRNSVKQSRIQSINKLVKEIKKLRDKKGTDEQKAKNVNKADRYHECIQIMKKLKDDDVSKFALMNEKSLAQITNNVNESPEIKAIARIADHRPLYSKVKAFREKYPDWKEALPLLFDTLGERYQEKKKKVVSKNQTNNNKNKTKLTENKAKSTTENQKKTSNVTYIENKSGTWRVEEIKPSEKDIKCDRIFVQNSENESDIINKSASDKINRLAESKEVTKNKTYKKSRNDDAVKVDKEENRKEIVKKESTKKESKENETPFDSEKVARTIDPFFVTKDNKEYLSVNVVSNTTNVEEKQPHFTPTKFKTDFSKPKSYEKNTKSFKMDVPKKYSKIEMKEETLHPSWEAKRKQSSITKFEGKKIKFD